MFTPCVVAGPSNPKQAAHHLDAEFVSMRIDEFVGLPSLVGDLACRHDRAPMLSPTGASSVQQILGTIHGRRRINTTTNRKQLLASMLPLPCVSISSASASH